jgi:hypothetical protein
VAEADVSLRQANRSLTQADLGLGIAAAQTIQEPHFARGKFLI